MDLRRRFVFADAHMVSDLGGGGQGGLEEGGGAPVDSDASVSFELFGFDSVVESRLSMRARRSFRGVWLGKNVCV